MVVKPKNLIGSRFVKAPQTIQSSPGMPGVAQTGSKVSEKQKKELAKYYTSMSGINETSVNAYMAISQEQSKIRKPKRKKKRAASQIAGHSPLNGVESRQNLLTQDDDEEHPMQSSIIKQAPPNQDEEPKIEV